VTSDHGGHVGVYRIDPRRDRVMAFIPLSPDPVAIAAAGGRIWVTENTRTGPCVVVRIDPATNRTTGSPILVDGSPDSIVSGAGSLWVTSGDGSSVDRIDPATGTVTAAWSIPDVDAVGAGSLWGTTGYGVQTTGYGVQRIDPGTGAVTAAITVPGARYVVFWADSAWAMTGTSSGGLVRIDPATNRVSGLEVWFGNDLTYAAADPGGLWVNDYSTGELLRFALASGG
jgi:DNA-binding beta-propeller fold protein YncE